MIKGIEETNQTVSLFTIHRKSHPWDRIHQRYAVGSHHQGGVVNVMSYGAFIQLEPRVEGLIHNDKLRKRGCKEEAREFLHVGDKVTVEILSIYELKQEILLALV